MLTAIVGLILLLLFLIAAAEILTAKAGLMFKLGWLLIILLLPGVGLLLYYFIGRGMRGQ